MTEGVRVRVLGHRIKLKVKYYIFVLTVMVGLQEHEEELLNGTGSGAGNNASTNDDEGADLYDDVLTTSVKQEAKEVRYS